MSSILITGGSGYIAKSLCEAFKNEYNVTLITRHDFDLTAFEAVNRFFQGKYFDVVIHCAVQGGSRLKTDSHADMDINLAMYYNLLQHRPFYNKFIHFGSGAEIYNSESPYGLSKKVIAKSIQEMVNFFNIRIFGVFDENELDTRMIKANIKRYIKKDPMMIQNKKMSFFYMKDLITLVRYYIESKPSELLKEANCAYATESTLLDIANIINELSDYKVPIYMDTELAVDYVSELNAPYGLHYIGLKQGIKEVYDKLLHQHSL